MNSCFVSFEYILMFFSLFSDSAAFFCFICFICYWRANQLNSKNAAFRFVSKVGHLWYFMGLSRRISVENRGLFCPYETSPHYFA